MLVERVNAKPTRWHTYLGLVLVPVLVVGGFLAAAWNADARMRTVEAAVVNLDEAVTIDDQYIPLGRQLTAALVDSDRQENLSWVLADAPTATSGLATGRFAAMVVIPENFSAAATSYATEDGTPQQATIQVETSPVAGVADATLGKVVAHAAAQTLNETLTSAYLDQIYIGFNDMGEQYTTLADGSAELADGTEKLADGIGEAASGAQQLYTGTRALADGLGTMASETKALPGGTRKLATGADDLADGLKQYTGGVETLIDSTIASAEQLPALVGGVTQSAQGAAGLSAGLQQYQGAMEGLAAHPSAAVPCPDQLQAAGMCDAFYAGITAGAGAAVQGLTTKDPGTGESLVSGAGQLASGLEQLAGGLAGSGSSGDLSQLEDLRDGGRALAKGARKLAGGADELADGMPALVRGISQAADGADQLADGVDQLGAGLITAASGSDKLAGGMREMADGIADGKDKLPSYSESERENLTTVVARPISTDGLDSLATPESGWASLLLVLSLWLGALATYAVVRALSSRLLTSSSSTASLIGRALLPGAVVVGVQALLVAAIAQLALDLPAEKLAAVTGVLVLAGLTFVVINHALVAWFGGIGRLVSIAFAVLTSAAALSSAAPAIFDALRPFSPLTPALDAMRSILTESSGATTSALTLVGWLVVAGTASAIAVARERTTTLDALVAAAA